MSSTRKIGTVSRGIRCPIIRQGDDLAAIVTESVLAAAEDEGFALRDRDVIAVTESVVARSQGNYASVQDIAALKKRGLWVSLWFVQNPETATCYGESNADAFVTDHVSLVREALGLGR